MGHDMTLLQAVILAVSAVITFVAYQSIPGDFERIGDLGRSKTVTLSAEFTLFVRSCGLDHLIMGAYMTLPVFTSGAMPPMFTWVVVASAAWVAAVSTVSAVVIRNAARG